MVDVNELKSTVDGLTLLAEHECLEETLPVLIHGKEKIVGVINIIKHFEGIANRPR
jgi:hypothetical protein